MTTQQLPATSFDRLTWVWKGHQIRYTVMGTGRPLVLIHGFGASIDHWRKNIPAFAAGGYRVFALDLLGFGASEKPALEYTLDLWVELLQDFWAAHVREPAVFVGNSIGALMSLMVVVDHPEIASGGVLLNCAGGLNHRPNELNPPLRTVMALFTQLIRSQTLGRFLFNQIRQKRRLRRTLHQVYCDPAAVTDELVEIIYAPTCDRGAQQVFASVLTAPPGPAPVDLLPKLKRPLLVLWGEADPWTPVSGGQIFQTYANQLREAAPIQFMPIPNAGHCPHDERPEMVNPLILEWLAKI